GASPFGQRDGGGTRHWPRMTHDQLVKVFPDQKTVHVPADGHPLKGYDLALAEVQRRGSTLGGASLTAARTAGIRVADAGGAPRRERDVLSKLLGIGQDDDEDKEAAAPSGRAAGGQQGAAAAPAPVGAGGAPPRRPPAL